MVYCVYSLESPHFQNFVTTRVVHLPKRAETSLITESNQSGPYHQLLQLCTARAAWSESKLHKLVQRCNHFSLGIEPFHDDFPFTRIDGSVVLEEQNTGLLSAILRRKLLFMR